jgi:osmotically-inducible protein OsmY
MLRSEDERIQGEVSDRLAAELPGEAKQVQVDVTRGEVTLDGKWTPLRPGAGSRTSPGALRA